jgi:HSP20 family protein
LNHFEEDKNKKKNNPFDFLKDEDFEKIFDELHRMLDNFDFKEMIEDMLRDGFDPNKRFIHGFSLNIGSDGKPRFQEFGNKKIKSLSGEPVLSDEREPLTDIIEGREDVAVTVEMPGVDKSDIDLNVTEKKLEIRVNSPTRKYHKIVDMPCNVKPKTTKATYKNGVLDIVIKRFEKKKSGAGYKVNID